MNTDSKKEGMPRGLRNNNPGNIRNSQSNDWLGEVDAKEKKDFAFEEFKEIKYGYRALLKLLRNYRINCGCITISDFIERWAPRDENDTASYKKAVCMDMQVPNTFVPDIDDKGTMCALAAAISKVENGIPADMGEVESGWDLLNVK